MESMTICNISVCPARARKIEYVMHVCFTKIKFLMKFSYVPQNQTSSAKLKIFYEHHLSSDVNIDSSSFRVSEHQP